MGHTQITGRDRLSELRDDVLSHVLSFLDAKEAARATALSSRWRDVMASVHTIALEQRDRLHLYRNEDNDVWYEQYELRPFIAAVTAALFSRSRCPSPTVSVPLRALRVSMDTRGLDDMSTVDQWISYALRHAATEFELDLRIGRDPVCWRPDQDSPADDDSSHNDSDLSTGQEKIHAVATKPLVSYYPVDRVRPEENKDDDDVGSSDDERGPRSWNHSFPEYTVLRRLFSCATLRSLRLGSCRLSPPPVISMPALEVLCLTHVPDEEEHVQRLISGCPRLADLTLEACQMVAALSLLQNRRLRQLAIRCCHNLGRVAVIASELHSFEYRGAVPDSSLLTVPGGGSFRSVTSCKVDICAVCIEKEASSEEQLAAIGSFLQLFESNTKHLHLLSARMGSSFVNLPAFPSLRHLELNGIVPRDGTAAAAVATTSIVLRQAPNLELLTLFFEAAPHEAESRSLMNGHHVYLRGNNREKFSDVHHLHYNKYDTLDYASSAASSAPPCLGSRIRKIELVHYQGGRAQRTLAKFLLDNAPVLETLFCVFAEGPEWIQTELMREMEGWVTNKAAIKEFH